MMDVANACHLDGAARATSSQSELEVIDIVMHWSCVSTCHFWIIAWYELQQQQQYQQQQ